MIIGLPSILSSEKDAGFLDSREVGNQGSDYSLKGTYFRGRYLLPATLSTSSLVAIRQKGLGQ